MEGPMKATSAISHQVVELVQDMATIKLGILVERFVEEYAAEQFTPGIDPNSVNVSQLLGEF